MNELQQLILQGEGETLDFKQTVSSPHKIAKTMVSFANHKGGKLLVGVSDKKAIIGVKSEDEAYMLDLAAGFYCKPPVEIDIREWELHGKNIIEVTIPEGNDKPYYAKGEDGKWWAYIRVKDKSLLASKIVVDVLKKRHSSQGVAFEYTSKEKALLEYLSGHEKITLKQFCKLVNISRWRAQKILINLISIGVIRSHTFEKEEFFTLSEHR